MIEDKIEIVIPTYNRANYLDETLGYLLNSPFKDCKITIRDNASPDETPEICKKYSKLFKNLNIIRNNKNIGGNANIMRCYEQATYPYVWVMGDNDYLNFDRCDDFIEAIESEKYDLIICNSALYVSEDINYRMPTPDDEPISEYIRRNKPDDENYLENSAQELASILKYHYFLIGGFISSTIYRTSLIDTDTIITGYNYASRVHPHYALIAKGVNENLLTYKTKYDVIFMRENTGSELDIFTWYPRYMDCVPLIEDKKLRQYAEKSGGHEVYYDLAASIIGAKAHHDPNLKNNVFILIKVMYKLRGWGKGLLYQIYIMMLYFMPTKICELIIKNINRG